MPRLQHIELPNGCSCTPPIIVPKGWKTNIKKDWAITYRYYEPGRLKPYQATSKGMNHVKNLRDRKQLTQELLEYELNRLQRGYNPRLEMIITPKDVEISPYHTLMESLDFARTKVKGVPIYTIDIKSCVEGIRKVAGNVGKMAVGEVRTKHLIGLLEECMRTNKRFSAFRHNRYRTYLITLFKILKKYESVEQNPALEIDRLKTTKKKRKVTSAEERKIISDHLKEKHYPFWRFIQIFFHSGTRETELMRLRGRDVDLKRQTFLCLVKKGKDNREEEGVIKNSVLYLWEEIMKDCKPDQYLFSKNLVPGDKQIRADQVGRRWRKYVKDELGIEADLYSLKHSNTTQVSSLLSAQDAARLNKHDEGMVIKIYDTEFSDRQKERIKNVANEF